MIFGSKPQPTPGRKVLVTGAGSGIGRDTAFAFARLDCALILADINTADLERTATLTRSITSSEVSTYQVDVAERASMEAFEKQVTEDHGAIDVLINNAGVGMAGPFLETDLDSWEWIVGINLMGVVYGCNLFGRHMVEAGEGKIINIASAAGFGPTGNLAAYSTTKSAVIALSQGLDIEMSPQGVNVTAICPGIINTNITTNTRYTESMAAVDAASKARDLYKRRNYPASKVAKAIVAAADSDTVVVPVSPEARVVRVMNRFIPRIAARLAAIDPITSDSGEAK